MSIIKQIKLEDINGSLTELADIGAKAKNVEFDNSDSGLEATNLQDAIVEITESGITGLKYTADGDNNTYATIQNAIEDGDVEGLPFKKNVATGYFSHAEGTETSAIGNGSHTEGRHTLANEQFAHAEGQGTTSCGPHSHAEGFWTFAFGNDSHAEGGGTMDFTDRVVIPVAAIGPCSHAEGQSTTANGENSHSEGKSTIAAIENSHAEGCETTAANNSAHAEGWATLAEGFSSHAEGKYTTASLENGHAEGLYTIAGQNAHAEGGGAQVSGTGEIIPVAALGYNSHAEGSTTTALGNVSHAEGNATYAEGHYAHAEGYFTEAIGDNSHAQNNHTMAQGRDQTVIGKYNIHQGNPTSISNTDYAFIIGNGTNSKRSNAFAVQWDGAMSQDNGETTFKFTKDEDGNKGYIDENGNFNTFGNGSGSGDMLASVYDPNGTVANVDGIVNYINNDYAQLHLIHEFSEYKSEYGLENVSNIMKYGAVGDGVADDSAALKAALKIVNDTTNIKVVYLPRGKYNLNGSNGTAITWPANVILAGESADFVEVLNSNIEAPKGIECRDVTFNGGTTRHLPGEGGEGGINPSLQDNNVILFVTPRSSGAYVTYTRCKFKNADIASLAFWFDTEAHPEARPLYATIIDNCEFFNLNHCGVYHSCNIYGAKITNNYFHDMGSNTLEEGSYACIRLGDTSNNTPSDIDTCLIANNKFENFQSKYDFVSHGTEWKGIAFNMLMIEALDVIVKNNEFINLLGWGTDREAVYTKARYAEISNNYFENACCGGEGVICCKARHFDNFTDRNANVHDNTIYGSYGSGITVYGPSSVFNNKIAIDHITRGIRAFGNMTAASTALGTIEITNNNINCNIGNIKIGDETVTYTNQPIISALDYPYKITINDNIVGVTRDNGISSKPPLIQIAALRSEVEIKNNSLDTSYTSANTISLAGNSNGASIIPGRNTININIEGNNLPNSNDKPSIYVDLSQTNLSSIRKILSISNNFIRTSEGSAINLSGSPNGNDILVYRSIYSTDVKSKQVYLKDFKYVYTEDSQYISVDAHSTLTPIYKTLDIAPITEEQKYLIRTEVLPALGAAELGNSYLYVGPSNPTAGITKGGIYRCISDGASTPTYKWLLDSIPLQLLQYVLTHSTSFDEFKAFILSA